MSDKQSLKFAFREVENDCSFDFFPTFLIGNKIDSTQREVFDEELKFIFEEHPHVRNHFEISIKLNINVEHIFITFTCW